MDSFNKVEEIVGLGVSFLLTTVIRTTRGFQSRIVCVSCRASMKDTLFHVSSQVDIDKSHTYEDNSTRSRKCNFDPILHQPNYQNLKSICYISCLNQYMHTRYKTDSIFLPIYFMVQQIVHLTLLLASVTLHLHDLIFCTFCVRVTIVQYFSQATSILHVCSVYNNMQCVETQTT